MRLPALLPLALVLPAWLGLATAFAVDLAPEREPYPLTWLGNIRAVAYRVARSEDGGATWQQLYELPAPQSHVEHPQHAGLLVVPVQVKHVGVTLFRIAIITATGTEEILDTGPWVNPSWSPHPCLRTDPCWHELLTGSQ
jgi:hypothetical protein